MTKYRRVSVDRVDRFVNLCENDITIIDQSGKRITLPATQNVARLTTPMPEYITIPGCPFPVVTDEVRGTISGLPDPEDGVVYITSYLVMQAALRPDVWCPATGNHHGAVKDEKRRVVAVRAFMQPYIEEEVEDGDEGDDEVSLG
jgi:hypothetical protein